MGEQTAERRAFVVVIDALGAGAEPDAASYGDEGANTLLHLAEAVGGLDLPAMGELGLGNILELPGVPPSGAPGIHGTLSHQGPGKDSTSGHWELFGVVMTHEQPVFPEGLPRELVTLLEDTTGLTFCGGGAMDGIAAIESLGEHHVKTGEVILYTSVDSVVQLAAHEDVMPRADLYLACAAGASRADGALRGRARDRAAVRRRARALRAHRRAPRLSVMPPSTSHLVAARAAGVDVHGVGKVARPLRRCAASTRTHRGRRTPGARLDWTSCSTGSTRASSSPT